MDFIYKHRVRCNATVLKTNGYSSYTLSVNVTDGITTLYDTFTVLILGLSSIGTTSTTTPTTQTSTAASTTTAVIETTLAMTSTTQTTTSPSTTTAVVADDLSLLLGLGLGIGLTLTMFLMLFVIVVAVILRKKQLPKGENRPAPRQNALPVSKHILKGSSRNAKRRSRDPRETRAYAFNEER
ncbi:uncharacterized protein LOC127870325 [Dreissena polymorpha]|nr:uncharacterized protein LOC127870325 [Dreissena polymorpha]